MEYSPERQLRDHMTRFLLALLLSVMSSAALAQTTSTISPNSSAPAQSSGKVDVPPGGCMPIGLTSAGEIVFPIQCKEFIELHRGKDVEPNHTAVEQKPAVVEDKPAAVEEKPVAVEDKPPAVEEKPTAVAEKPAAVAEKSAAVAPENSKSADNPPEAVPMRKRAERKPRERVSSNGCQHYRTYDSASGTYRSYDGRIRPCR